METGTFRIREEIQYLLWDWNGTLLDDMGLCLSTVNRMLLKRGKPVLDSERYRQIFTFPVRNYYLEAGFSFDNEPFEVLAVEFIDGYYSNFGQTRLHPSAKEILLAAKEAGYRQGVLSASKHEALLHNLKHHGLTGFFDHLSGITDHHADGKVEAGRKILANIGLPLDDILMIGDTLHDTEVAEELGIEFVFVSHGHQSAERLRKTDYPIFQNLESFRKAIDV